MKRRWLIGAMVCAMALAIGCNRPSKGECKKAILNIQKLYGSERSSDAEVASAVRSCQGNATKSSVKCFIQATSLKELRECEGDMFKKMFGEAPPDFETPKPEAAKPATPAPAPEAIKPADGEAKPADGADGEAKPADGEAKPADGEAKPADGEAKPADGEAKPAGDKKPEPKPAGGTP